MYGLSDLLLRYSVALLLEDDPEPPPELEPPLEFELVLGLIFEPEPRSFWHPEIARIDITNKKTIFFIFIIFLING